MKKIMLMFVVAMALFVAALGGKTFPDGDKTAQAKPTQDSVWAGDPGGCPVDAIRYEFIRYMDSGGSVLVRIYQCLPPGYWYEIGSYWQS